jgi:GT2 family glycosyltransferase
MIPVVIPFYKNKDQLDQCLSHLKRQTMPVEIFIRDNSEYNIYFTAAVNEGIRHFMAGPAEYIIILNQDMYLEPLAVEEMVQFMNRNPACGIAGPLQLYHKEHDYVIWAGCFDAFPIGKHQHGPLENFKNDQPVCWANGACMILRKTMIQEIGLLDKNLVFIGSDSDYCFTARSRGWQIWRIAAARGIHEHGASGNSGNPEIELLKIKDMLYFSKKWLNGNLYRALSFEGPQLSPEKVDDIVNRLQAAKLEVSQQISKQK